MIDRAREAENDTGKGVVVGIGIGAGIVVIVGIGIDAGIEVVVVDDTPEPHTPDSIFPNNWASFHADGRVVLYAMEAENRRSERRYETAACAAGGIPIHATPLKMVI